MPGLEVTWDLPGLAVLRYGMRVIRSHIHISLESMTSGRSPLVSSREVYAHYRLITITLQLRHQMIYYSFRRVVHRLESSRSQRCD